MTTMNNRTKILAIVVIPIVAALAFGFGGGFSNNTASAEETGTIYEVTATNARLIREELGEVTEDVQGIPAEPVHSFDWDGSNVQSIPAEAKLEIDPVNNTGEIKVEWTDPDGNEWTLEQTAFAPPVHPSGFVIDPDVGDDVTAEFNGGFGISGDPVTQNVFLHGATMAGGPVLPRILNHLATWGPAEVTLNGEPFENPYDGPAPLWVTHTMTTLGVRQPDGTVLNADGGFYSPADADNGAVDYSDLEFHMVFHDAPGPEMTANFPPPLSFFYHLQFEDVKLEVKSTE